MYVTINSVLNLSGERDGVCFRQTKIIIGMLITKFTWIERPLYIETQASLYTTFYTESPKAEARNTFVFCL